MVLSANLGLKQQVKPWLLPQDAPKHDHQIGEAMPKKLEKELKAEAKRKGMKGERANAYVYGTLRKTGWKPDRELKRHGKA